MAAFEDSPDDFARLFEERLSPALASLEPLGRRFSSFMRLFTRILVVLALTSAGILYLRSPGEKRWVIPPGVAIFLWFVVQSTFDRLWKRRFKREILSPALAAIQNDMKYQPEGLVPKDTFQRSHLFPVRLDKYAGEDLVRGKVGATALEFCELQVQHCVKRWSLLKWIDKDAYVGIFRGFFFVADFNKHFLGTTLVLPEGNRALNDVLARSLDRENRRQRQCVLLEDPEFERLFSVHSDDQVEARYLLSTSFMERLKEYRKHGDDTLAVSFSASKIFLAIFTRRDLFVPVTPYELSEIVEGGKARDALRRRLKQFLGDLDFGRELVEELHLNTRIWTRGAAEEDGPLPSVSA